MTIEGAARLPADGDRIEIRGLRVQGRHGALVGEQDHPQPFEIDLDVYLDLGRAGATDDLTATLDYGEVCDEVAALVATTHVALLEALAATIADAVARRPSVEAVDVTVRKLAAPLGVVVGTVGVRVVRRGR